MPPDDFDKKVNAEYQIPEDSPTIENKFARDNVEWPRFTSEC
jgi:hypothetical protein